MAQRAEFRKHNRIHLRKQKKKWYDANKDEINIRRKKYFLSDENKYKRKKWDKKYYNDNRARINKKKAVRQAKMYNNDMNFRLSVILRPRINKIIKGKVKSGSAIKDLGCSLDELIRHIESKFQLGMSWENYGEWHIDHIKPLSSFDLENREQFLEACNYTNLQPLWAHDNLKKGAIIP